MAKIKIDDNLFERVKKLAQTAGYPSPEEFITHMIEKELAKLETPTEDEQAVLERLRGLGYIE